MTLHHAYRCTLQRHEWILRVFRSVWRLSFKQRRRCKNAPPRRRARRGSQKQTIRSSHKGWTCWTGLNAPRIALPTRRPKWISVYDLPKTGASCDTADPDDGQYIW